MGWIFRIASPFVVFKTVIRRFFQQDYSAGPKVKNGFKSAQLQRLSGLRQRPFDAVSRQTLYFEPE